MGIHNVFEDAKPKSSCDMGNVFADFLLNKGLYDTIEITKENIDDLISLTSGSVKINAYCNGCGDMRIFTGSPIYYYDANDMRHDFSQHMLSEELSSLQTYVFSRVIDKEKQSEERQWNWKNWECEEAVRLMVFSFACAMEDSHKIDYVVITDGYSMRKIGQYPSVADLSFPELKEYGKVLSKEDMREFRRAIGLHAQGIGVGSYVYLRRIFERIIDSAKNSAIADGAIDEETYVSAHVDERIKLLKDYLPEMLVNAPVFYSIVSKGIHELSEEDCTAFFPVLQESIFMILRQWEQMRQEKEAQKRLTMSMSKIASIIK